MAKKYQSTLMKTLEEVIMLLGSFVIEQKKVNICMNEKAEEIKNSYLSSWPVQAGYSAVQMVASIVPMNPIVLAAETVIGSITAGANTNFVTSIKDIIQYQVFPSELMPQLNKLEQLLKDRQSESGNATLKDICKRLRDIVNEVKAAIDKIKRINDTIGNWASETLTWKTICDTHDSLTESAGILEGRCESMKGEVSKMTLKFELIMFTSP